MTFEEFVLQVVPVKGEPTALSERGMLLYQSNAMAGEVGEVANEVKKIVRDGGGDEVSAAVVDECGDVLFYMERLLELFDLTIEDAAEALLRKLVQQRQELAQ